MFNLPTNSLQIRTHVYSVYIGIRNLTQTRVNTCLRARSNRFPRNRFSRCTRFIFSPGESEAAWRVFTTRGSIAPLLSSLITGASIIRCTEFLAYREKRNDIIAIFFHPPLPPLPSLLPAFRMKIRARHAGDEIRRLSRWIEFADVRSSGEHPFVPDC